MRGRHFSSGNDFLLKKWVEIVFISCKVKGRTYLDSQVSQSVSQSGAAVGGCKDDVRLGIRPFPQEEEDRARVAG